MIRWLKQMFKDPTGEDTDSVRSFAQARENSATTCSNLDRMAVSLRESRERYQSKPPRERC